MKKVTLCFPLQSFLWTRLWTMEKAGTSYQSLSVAKDVNKNSFFRMTLSIWKLWKEKKKTDKTLNISRTKKAL